MNTFKVLTKALVPPGNVPGQPAGATSERQTKIKETKTLPELNKPDAEGNGLTQMLKNDEALGKIRFIFVNKINPLTVLHVFHFFDQNVLVKQDIERVRAVAEQKGSMQGAVELLSILPRYDGWISCLMKVLRHPTVKQSHIAVQMETLLGITFTPQEQPDGAAGHSGLSETAEDECEEVDFVQYFQEMQLKLREQEKKLRSLQKEAQQITGMEKECFKKGDDGLYHQMTMVSIEGELSNCVQEIEERLEKEHALPDHKFYFHGTIESHAKSIWRTGINLYKGRKCRDFSNGKGFYVTEDPRQAVSFAKAVASKAGVDKAAVVVFRVSRAMQMENHIDLYGDDKLKDWENVVEHFHGGENNQSLKEALAEIKFISGPVSHLCEDGFMPHYATSQLCILDENYATRFGQLKNIPCCFFLNPESIDYDSDDWEGHCLDHIFDK